MEYQIFVRNINELFSIYEPDLSTWILSETISRDNLFYLLGRKIIPSVYILNFGDMTTEIIRIPKTSLFIRYSVTIKA